MKALWMLLSTEYYENLQWSAAVLDQWKMAAEQK